jgi:MFS family permease
MTFRLLVRALRHRNYRLFYSGQSVSLIGTWLTRVATGWLVYRLTDSVFMLGLVGFVGQVPTFLLGPVAGVWVDRLDRHRVLLVTQVAGMVQSALLAVFALSETITVVHILVLGALQGCVNAFDKPARQAFILEMVDDRVDLPNAVALNSSMVNLARMLGPSAAGVLIVTVGEAWCFLLDAVSYAAVIASLLAMRVKRSWRPEKLNRVLTDLGEGLGYVAGFTPIRDVLLLLGAVGFMGIPCMVLMPVFATSVLSGGPHTLGFLMAGSGLGALVAALYLASRKSVLGLGWLIPTGAGTYGLSLVAFAESRALWLSMLIMVLCGASLMILMAAANTVVQTLVDDDKRGRVMSLFAMAFVGTEPFGSLLAGVSAKNFGAPSTVLLGGALCTAGAACFLGVLPRLRANAPPAYEKLGILQLVSHGSVALRERATS